MGLRDLHHDDVGRVAVEVLDVYTQCSRRCRPICPHADQARRSSHAIGRLRSVGGTATVAFLFVDMVGSTDMLRRLGDDANDEVRRRYMAILREALTDNG